MFSSNLAPGLTSKGKSFISSHLHCLYVVDRKLGNHDNINLPVIPTDLNAVMALFWLIMEYCYSY